MSLASATSESELRSSLKPFAPYSVVDRGFEYAAFGQVSECQAVGNLISGQVIEDEETFFTSVEIKSDQFINPKCTCCSEEDLADQWCSHLVALTFHCFQQNIYSNSGNSKEASQTDVFKINASPEEIVKSLETARHLGYHCISKEIYPEVKVTLSTSNQSLGIKLYFDQLLITPSELNSDENLSSRQLDQVLLQLIEDHCEWDDLDGIWYLNASHQIKIILGLLEEYPQITLTETDQKVTFNHDLLDLLVQITWQESTVELQALWVMPDGTHLLKETEIVGTEDFWTLVNDQVFKLSPSANELIKLYPFSNKISFSYQQAGAILELLEKDLIPKNLLKVVNPAKQPKAEIKRPTIRLQVEAANSEIFDRGVNLDQINLRAYLNFEYPPSPQNKKVVYIPDRAFEEECSEKICQLGFEPQEGLDYYNIGGDYALDLLYKEVPEEINSWGVEGLQDIKDSIRFSKLTLNMDIKKSGEQEQKGSIDWFECNITLSQNSATVPLTKIFQSTNKGFDRWIQLDNGAWAEIPGGGLKRLKTTLGFVSANYKHSSKIETKISVAQAITLQSGESANVKIKAEKSLIELGQKLANFENIKSINPPAIFKGQLRKYQKEGLSWLNFLHEYGFNGILADEMGLGKTVQTLALVQSLKIAKAKAKAVNKPVLVIAPTSVTTNWLYEAMRFTPNLKTLVLQGANRKKDFANIPDYDIIITSYALLRIDRSELEKHSFLYIILDEAQNIKNPLTATCKAAKALKSESRLALSGTPTENRPLELWSIFDFLMPGYLGSLEFFKNQIEKPILENINGIESTRFLKNKTKPFLLRRLKSEVEKQLPPKTESEMHVAMTDSQKALYGQILAEVRPQIMDAVEAKGVRGASISILAALLRLRQVCNHPNSIEGLKDLPDFDSGKFELLKDLVLESLAAGRKILLFSQFREMLAIIKRWMETEKINYLYLDGSTKNRQDLVDSFNADERIKLFLISLKAGGTGLNLTGADTVIIYDPWWNPAVENQAIDRAHRIGQVKPVNVYRLVTEDSIEQKIMNLKSKKSDIIDSLINDNGLSNLNLTKDDLDQLFQ